MIDLLELYCLFVVAIDFIVQYKFSLLSGFSKIIHKIVVRIFLFLPSFIVMPFREGGTSPRRSSC